MKWIYRLMILGVLAVALGAPFFMEMKNGKPSFSMPDTASLVPDASDLVPDFSSDSDSPVSSSKSKNYTKWQDQNGQWHYGDKPPVDAVNLTTVSVNSNANIVQSYKVPEPEESEQSAFDEHQRLAKQQAEKAKKEEEEILTIENALNIKNDAQSVVDTLNKRTEALSKFTGSQ